MATEITNVQREDLRRLLRQRPFVPFRIHLKDGRVFEIRYPDVNLLGERVIDIGIPEPDKEDPFAQYWVFVFFTQIDRVVVEEPAAPKVG
jgi:hypothetical protein